MRRLASLLLVATALAACEVRSLPVPYLSPNPDGVLPDGPRAGAGGVAEGAWMASVPLGGGGGPTDASSAAPSALPSAVASPGVALDTVPAAIATQIPTVEGAWGQATTGEWTFYPALDPRLVQPAAPEACPADYVGDLATVIYGLPDRTARDPLTIELYALDRVGSASLSARTIAVARIQRLAWQLERRGALDSASAARIALLAGCWLL